MDPKNPADQPNSSPFPENPLPAEVPSVEQTNYSREAGKKTLFLVVSIITLVTLLSVASLLLINKKSASLVRTNAQEVTKTQSSEDLKVPSLSAPTARPINSDEEELDSIDFGSSDKDIEELTGETEQL